MVTKLLYHRGDEKNAYPNTISSFEMAARGKGEGVELDVQFTRDNVPVVFHDRKIDASTSSSGFLTDYTLKNLKKIELDLSDACSVHRIPTLEEVLQVVKEMEVIDIEIKQRSGENFDQIVNLMEVVEEQGVLDRVIFTSFNHYSVEFINSIDPEVSKGIIYYARLYEPWKYAKKLNAEYLVPLHRTVTSKLIEETNKRDLKIMAYGSNEREDLKSLIEIGVDYIISDEVDRALKIRDNYLDGE